ncbi:hypothetical protein AYL99_00186 [Fonsecaea erecta]|uniref:3-oxoacyl-[acyl-carrier protein] reductase n=1 Tax=Fonsecaea erecta TaxID=1367422 RepID=A0A178ZWQ7_9EURO|nr:hypothetical protein AYL99_00186 [Fonsecaea erecta]OAP64214.1 hypothetical protein AYL99_00186 [Fonsecaea erecta]
MASERLSQIERHLADPSRIDDQVVLVTGAGQGIGRSAALLLASKGAKIGVNDLDKDKAQAVVDEILAKGGQAECYPGNVLDALFPGSFVAAILKKWGKINCLINNAGFCQDSAIHKMTDDKFDIIMKVHNYTPFRMIRALSTHWMDPANLDMAKSIVNVSSTSGLHGSMGQINYATAKAGIVGLTKTVALEWGR